MSSESWFEVRLAAASAHYKRIASEMTARRRDPHATIRYHLFADGIYWMDEIPWEADSAVEDALRSVLHHRTALIREEPAERTRPLLGPCEARVPRLDRLFSGPLSAGQSVGGNHSWFSATVSRGSR